MARIPHGFAPLSHVMYKFACHTAHLSGSDQFSPVVALPISSVLHASASLEAFLNEAIEMASRVHAELQEPLRALERLETRNKWIVVPRLLFGRTFDRGGAPFQSFSALIELRNALMHYKPLTRPVDFMPPFARKLASLFPFTPEPSPSVVTDWQQKILNRECARWACMTARALVLGWYDLAQWAEGRANADWLWSLGYLEGKEAGDPPPSVLSFEVKENAATVIDLAVLGRPSQ